MKQQQFEVDKLLLIKASLFFVLILITSFFVGIVIGRHAAPQHEIVSENEMRDRLDNCKYEVQEVLHKYNNENKALANCINRKRRDDTVVRLEKTVPVDKVENSRGTPRGRPVEKAAPTEKVVSVEKAAPIEKAVPIEPSAPIEKVAPLEPKNIEEKIEPIKPVARKKCKYALQLFSDTSKDNARTALSRMTDITARLETATIRKQLWYRIRYGCYANKEDAKKALNYIREKHGKAIIVAH